MQSIRSLSNEALLTKTQELADTERRISVEILHHLAEIDRRRAYAGKGYGSLWDYALKELRYSENAAYRRISAMRALQNQPELEEKIQKGVLSVTTVCQVQSFLKAERDYGQKPWSKEMKTDLYLKCENLSSREVTRELVKISPLALRVQKERVITEDRTQISFIADPLLLKKIHRVRDLSVNRLGNPGSYPELVNMMSDITLDEIDPLRKPDKNVALIAPKVKDAGKPGYSSRHIPSALRTKIWKQYEGRCAFISPETGHRCESRFGLEIEHCKPFALGGSSSEAENLKLLCRKHNQWQAIQTYGLEKMEPYLRRD